MSKLIGQNLGRYQILELIGEGGMASVYKGYDTRLEREVAIKFIQHEAFPPNQLVTMLKRFEREAKALGGLSHPNIVGVIDYGEFEGMPYLVMVYLSGGTLRERLGKPMPWRNAIRLLLPVAHALEYTHEHNIIHRDVKPSNILMTDNGQPMLTDFGLVKIFEDKGATNLTASGAGLGTPNYMAPEQWTGETTAQSDLYSLAVVLYEMITGQRPYSADTPAGILLKQVNEPLPLPKQYVPDLPQNVESVLLKALARKQGDRYPDMRSFTDELQDLLDGKEVTATAIKTDILREQMTGIVERQPKFDETEIAKIPAQSDESGPAQIPVEQARNAAPAPAPGKAKRGIRLWIIAGGIGAGLCACFALVSGGYLTMNGFNSVPPENINTAIPTSTVSGPASITVTGCMYADDCPDAVDIVELFGKNETQELNTEYKVSISQDKKVSFFAGWCATDRKTLNGNLNNITFVFSIDGISYIANNKQEYFNQQNETDSTKQNSCYGIGAVAGGWQKAHTYRVVFGHTIEKPIFDGWDSFPQSEQLYIYLITVE
ncbi:MAG TPA: protein kinase [Anaerolineales bacterium]|nr:protein kinase [Anaerolineales bacterium]